MTDIFLHCRLFNLKNPNNPNQTKKYLNNMCFQKFFMLKIFNDKKRTLKGFDYFLNY